MRELGGRQQMRPGRCRGCPCGVTVGAATWMGKGLLGQELTVGGEKVGRVNLGVEALRNTGPHGCSPFVYHPEQMTYAGFLRIGLQLPSEHKSNNKSSKLSSELLQIIRRHTFSYLGLIGGFVCVCSLLHHTL